ncbi:hypothetical protein L211DRAFT_833340 [Terfezia boudieri ATCC MYA-4762]|uniref:Uncharacterized protein n=1 Tax=Terfezia boudieri ATCC MYA-4762 TaxID=1051890 RepID=A0A3N4MIM7_9PEZI|nr:hypothetical protein L211DRAFT_833340 [Terfezia boudieri ATCC MYA-4762]
MGRECYIRSEHTLMSQCESTKSSEFTKPSEPTKPGESTEPTDEPDQVHCLQPHFWLMSGRKPCRKSYRF